MIVDNRNVGTAVQPPHLIQIKAQMGRRVLAQGEHAQDSCEVEAPRGHGGESWISTDEENLKFSWKKIDM